jgi:hypothetical protein
MRYLLLFLLLGAPVDAGTIVYRTDTGRIVAYSTGSLPVTTTTSRAVMVTDWQPPADFTNDGVILYKVVGSEFVKRTPAEIKADVSPADRRATKYQARVDQWTHAIVRYEKRLLDARLSAAQKTKIQAKLDAAVLKVQDESTSIETEDPD